MNKNELLLELLKIQKGFLNYDYQKEIRQRLAEIIDELFEIVKGDNNEINKT